MELRGRWGWARRQMAGFGIVVGRNMGVAADSSFALVSMEVLRFSFHWLVRTEAK